MKTRMLILSFVALFACQLGCQSMASRETKWDNPKDVWNDLTGKEEKIVYGTPERMAVLWSSTAMSGRDGKAIRGFGGRIYFYDKKNKPIRVDGELTVYAFDDSENNKQTNPDRTYKFGQDTLQRHFSTTQIGPSYSIWIPWDPAGGESKAIALLPMFKTEKGQIVRGEHTLTNLAGKSQPQSTAKLPFRVVESSPTVVTKPRANESAAPTNYPEQQASYVGESATALPTPPRMQSTTIDVPRSMAMRLNALANAPEARNTQTMNSDGSAVSVSYGTVTGSVDSSRPKSKSVFAAPAEKPVFGKPGAYR